MLVPSEELLKEFEEVAIEFLYGEKTSHLSFHFRICECGQYPPDRNLFFLPSGPGKKRKLIAFLRNEELRLAKRDSEGYPTGIFQDKLKKMAR